MKIEKEESEGIDQDDRKAVSYLEKAAPGMNVTAMAILFTIRDITGLKMSHLIEIYAKNRAIVKDASAFNYR